MTSTATSIAPAPHGVPGAIIMAQATLPGGAGDLLQRLADALETHSIAYCQWKGMWRTGSGSDIDLLVSSEAAPQFRSLVQDLGFTSVLPSGERQIPGVESYLGHDPVVSRPLHLHVHYRLVVGDYWRTLYRVPIEQAMLESSKPGDPFRIPSPPYQLLVYVLRMMLRLRGWPLPLSQARWLSGIQGQLDYLDGRSDRDALGAILAQHLPIVDLRFLDRCLQALRGQSDPAESASVRRELHRRLRAHSRPPSPVALLTACGEKVLPNPLRPMLFDGRMRPTRGGLVVALVGGDGAGKSTCARELCDWLGADLPIQHAHLGRPPRSLLTLIVGGALKAERLCYRLLRRDPTAGSYIELLRHLCTARDRHLLYIQVRRHAVAGGIAICERYPIAEDRVLVGPCIPQLIGPEPTRLGRLLRDTESRYYTRILPPDMLFVLQLDPELAVARKHDEPADYVRARTRVIWETDWSRTPAQVIDVSRPLADVVQDLKTHVWSAL